MSVGDLICDSTFLLGCGRYESAMCLAMNSLDATAQKEYPQLAGTGHVRKRCEKFVSDHYDVISVVGTGGAVYSAPGSRIVLTPPSKPRPYGLETILYELVRCSLDHDASLPSDVYFNLDPVFGRTNVGLSVPVHMIYAVILAVAGAPANANATTVPGTPDLIVMGHKIRLSECWGQKSSVLSALGVSPATGLSGAAGVGVNHGTILNGTIGPNGVAMNKGTIQGCVFDTRHQPHS